MLFRSGVPVSVIRKAGVFEDVIRIKYTIGNEDRDGFTELDTRIASTLSAIGADYAGRERKGLA